MRRSRRAGRLFGATCTVRVGCGASRRYGVVADTDEALVAACAPGAEVRWPALYAQARDDGDRSVRTDAEHRAVGDARAQVLGMMADRSGPFAAADRWAVWRWQPAWPAPRLPQPVPLAETVASESA
ncbi:hypothetical protein ABZ605_00975 [Streptomyces sp. NPDC012765]|uniref:hypothetical protein n=1 Tax=Streptomyces sp. NPDC012765 TaxID=3155249 RepID=UPI0033FA1508